MLIIIDFMEVCFCFFFFFSSRRRHTRLQGDWSSDVCSSDLLTSTRREGGVGRSPYRSESLEAYGVTHTGSTMATATKTRLKIFPLADRVAIRPLEETEEMKGGLYIPDTAKEKPIQGEVIAVGPGRMEKGQRVDLQPR